MPKIDFEKDLPILSLSQVESVAGARAILAEPARPNRPLIRYQYAPSMEHISRS